MTTGTITDHEKYIKNWLNSETAVSPLIIASYSNDILDNTLNYACNLNSEGDVLFLKEDKGSYKIKETRELINTISRTSFSTHRLIVIKLAEKLTLPAVNALLKSLEEPSKYNRWILTTKQLPLILPTIRSRCQIFKINKNTVTEQSVKGAAFWQELLPSKKSDHIGEETLSELHNYLTHKIQEQGPSPQIYRALLRLRDYHKIKSHRGNTKLARDVLLASLYQLSNN